MHAYIPVRMCVRARAVPENVRLSEGNSSLRNLWYCSRLKRLCCVRTRNTIMQPFGGRYVTAIQKDACVSTESQFKNFQRNGWHNFSHSIP
jgi:hypothetical protein